MELNLKYKVETLYTANVEYNAKNFEYNYLNGSTLLCDWDTHCSFPLFTIASSYHLPSMCNNVIIYNKPSLNICVGTRHGYWVSMGE